MLNPAAMALAAITVMLWILWSDSLRSRRPTAILYAIRIALYLIMSGNFILNMVRYPDSIGGSTRIITILAALIGVVGAGYFARKMVLRR